MSKSKIIESIYKTAQQTIMETLAKEHPTIFQEILNKL